MTSPMNSSGVTTSMDMIGSSSTGPAPGAPSRTAINPAIRKATSFESTSWKLPSIASTATSTIG